MAPAATRKRGEVFADSDSEFITNWSALSPPAFAVKSRNEEKPARVTPMKFTRSLPANAMASENVPMSTIILNTLNFIQWSSCISTVKNANEPRSNMNVLLFIHCIISGVTSDEPLRPLMSMK